MWDKIWAGFYEGSKNADLWQEDSALAGSEALIQTGLTIRFPKGLRISIIFFNEAKQLL